MAKSKDNAQTADDWAQDNENFFFLAMTKPVLEEDRSWTKKLEPVSEFLKHPFTLFLLGSLLLPVVIYYLNNYKSLMDSRQKKALEIVTEAAAFEGSISSVYKDLSLFHEDNQPLFREMISSADNKKSNDNLEKRRDKFKEFFNPRYSEFEKTGSENLWVESLYAEGIALKLFTIEEVNKLNSLADNTGIQITNSKLRDLSENIKAYKESFKKTTSKIGEYKLMLANNKFEPDKVFNAGSIINEELNKQRQERKKITQNLVEIFTPQSFWKIW